MRNSFIKNSIFYRLFNCLILIYSSGLITLELYKIVPPGDGVLKYYASSLLSDFLIILFAFAYLTGSILNLLRDNRANHLLTFGSMGFVIAAIADFLLVMSYPILFYFVYIPLNLSVLLIVDLSVIYKRGIQYFLLNSAIVLIFYKYFDSAFIF